MRKPHQVIFINGPRRSGKDTAANCIMKEFVNVRHKKFAGSMKHALRAFFGLDDATWKALEIDSSNEFKLLPLPQLFGMTWVEALIWFSEDVMKPKFGPDIFGNVLVTDMRKPTSTALTVISDCGFTDELFPIIYSYGAANCHMFQLFRDGHTFEGDSRHYISKEDLPSDVKWYIINNDFELDMYKRQILIRTNTILGMDRTFD